MAENDGSRRGRPSLALRPTQPNASFGRMPNPVPVGPTPDGMRDYIITLVPDSTPVNNRWDLVRKNEARTRDLIKRIKVLVNARQVSDGIDMIGEPLALPFVEIVCTPEVADLLRDLPEVQSVSEDNVAMTLV